MTGIVFWWRQKWAVSFSNGPMQAAKLLLDRCQLRLNNYIGQQTGVWASSDLCEVNSCFGLFLIFWKTMTWRHDYRGMRLEDRKCKHHCVFSKSRHLMTDGTMDWQVGRWWRTRAAALSFIHRFSHWAALASNEIYFDEAGLLLIMEVANLLDLVEDWSNEMILSLDMVIVDL